MSDSMRPSGPVPSRHALETADGVLTLAVWFALLTATGELAQQGFHKFVLDRPLYLGADIIWLTPAAYVALFTGLSLLILLAARILPGLTAVRVTTFVFAAAGSLGVLLVHQRLHKLALLIFAVGVAMQVSAVAARRRDGLVRLVQLTAAPLLICALVAGLGVASVRTYRERSAIAGLADAAPSAPNVILIILDTVRALSLSLYGNERPTTPALEKLARNAIVFERAVAPSPWTLPTHASIFTGRYPPELGVDFRVPLNDRYPTLAEIVQRTGYLTAGFVANTFYGGYEYGLNRGFIHYEDYSVTGGELLLATSLGRALSASRPLRRWTKHYDVVARKTAPQVSADFLRWLDDRPDRPFFAFLNYYDAHEPYLPPAPYYERFGSQAGRPLATLDHSQLRHATRWGKRTMTAAGRQREQAAYEGAIAYLDATVGGLLRDLRERDLLDNSLVVITSDHGEHLGDAHDQFGHGATLYAQELFVPLMILLPGGSRALRVAEPVTLRDLTATMLEFTNPGERAVPGNSLAHHWVAARRRPATASPILGFHRENGVDLRSIVVAPHHYIRIGTREEVYDVFRDPEERDDLIAAGRLPAAALEQLRAALAAAIGTE